MREGWGERGTRREGERVREGQCERGTGWERVRGLKMGGWWVDGWC